MRTLCAHHEALWPQMRVVLNWGEKYEVRLRPLSQRVPATGCSCFGFPFSVRLPRLKALAPCSSPLLGNPHRSPPVANPRPRSGPPVKCTRPCGPGGSRSFSLDPAAIVPEEKMASSPKISVLAVISVFCLLPAWLVAGADPAVVRSPAPVHHFFDARNIASFTVNAIVMGTDIATTHQALQVPGARSQSSHEVSGGHNTCQSRLRGRGLGACLHAAPQRPSPGGKNYSALPGCSLSISCRAQCRDSPVDDSLQLECHRQPDKWLAVR